MWMTTSARMEAVFLRVDVEPSESDVELSGSRPSGKDCLILDLGDLLDVMGCEIVAGVLMTLLAITNVSREFVWSMCGLIILNKRHL